MLVADRTGTSNAYGLFNLQERSELFIGSGVDVYEGMIVGENARSGDMDVNPCKEKKLTNIRTHAHDEALRLTPPRPLTLESAIEFIGADELVEVTPTAIRLRKRLLVKHERERERGRAFDLARRIADGVAAAGGSRRSPQVPCPRRAQSGRRPVGGTAIGRGPVARVPLAAVAHVRGLARVHATRSSTTAHIRYGTPRRRPVRSTVGAHVGASTPYRSLMTVAPEVVGWQAARRPRRSRDTGRRRR